MRAKRSERDKEKVLTKCPEILAALMYEDDLQKLVKLLLVTERVDRVCIEGYISVVWKPAAPVT